ncbi:MAG: flavin reductase, partial [Clostridia bacterium]|nr:flavin reductase [Clostridia bacterium]
MFTEIKPKDLDENFIKNIADEWMLITAGDQKKYNMMTASWGFMGEVWGSDGVAVLIRPNRYTLEFINNNDYFTLSFYGDNKDIHKVCGSKSGRDVDKTALCGLTPVFDKAPYFEQARLVFICKKQYVQQMESECFTDKEPLGQWYDNDLHYMIIGKIEKVL